MFGILEKHSEHDIAQSERWIRRGETFAKESLDLCNNYHSCSNLESRLPTRVIDVSGGRTVLLRPTLDGSGMSPHGLYVALSYCLGQAQPITTTTINLNEYLSELPFSEFPRSLQEAVVITRQLGLKYLWIDSLCIIQDSLEDKEREMAHMCQVYQNAHVTIVGASAAGSSEGYLTSKPFVGGTAPFRVLWQDVTLNESSVTRYIIKERSEREIISREPLHQRAWTLQECFLSPRLLIYGRDCMIWKCELIDRCTVLTWIGIVIVHQQALLPSTWGVAGGSFDRPKPSLFLEQSSQSSAMHVVSACQRYSEPGS
jgi:hypothetical protein